MIAGQARSYGCMDETIVKPGLNAPSLSPD